MTNRKVTDEMLITFKTKLKEEEKTNNTIEKYMRDIRYFLRFTQGREGGECDLCAHLLAVFTDNSYFSLCIGIEVDVYKRQIHKSAPYRSRYTTHR